MILVAFLALGVALVASGVLLRVLPEPAPEERPPHDEGLPWTVKAYAVVYLLGSLIFAVLSYGSLRDSGRGLLIGIPLLFLLFVVPIVRGSRVGWVIVTMITVAGFLTLPYSESPAAMTAALANGLVSVGLLLHPETQRWCRVRLWRGSATSST